MHYHSGPRERQDIEHNHLRERESPSQLRVDEDYVHLRTTRRKRWRHPTLTGYRILIIVLTAGFGLTKAVMAYMGQSVATTSLDWVFGVVCSIGLYWLGLYEEDPPPSLYWLFVKDYSSAVLPSLDDIPLTPAMISLLALVAMGVFGIMIVIFPSSRPALTLRIIHCAVIFVMYGLIALLMGCGKAGFYWFGILVFLVVLNIWIFSG